MAEKTAPGLNRFDLFGLLFLWAKMTAHVDWSWWLVLLPLEFEFVAILIDSGCKAYQQTYKTKGL